MYYKQGESRTYLIHSHFQYHGNGIVTYNIIEMYYYVSATSIESGSIFNFILSLVFIYLFVCLFIYSIYLLYELKWACWAGKY